MALRLTALTIKRDDQVKNTFKNLMTIALSALFVLTLSAGCATLEGVGEDIESAGESVQDAADGE